MRNCEPCDETLCTEEEVADLQAKLDDMVELLHMWMGEAFSYRQLAEAVTSHCVSLEEAKRMLASHLAGSRFLGCPCVALRATPDPPGNDVGCRFKDSRIAMLPLGVDEFKSLEAVAKRSGLELHEFLWACVESMMNNADDEDVLKGCREAAHRRFRAQVLPDWAAV